MPTPESGLPGEGWLQSAEWRPRARRLGPLRYSDLGPRRLAPVRAGHVEPLAAWLGAAADRWWDAAGRPDPYTLVVVSGDDGHLARAVLSSSPGCAPALRYVLVNPDGAARREPPPGLARLVDLEAPALLYPPGPPVPGRPAPGEAPEPGEASEPGEAPEPGEASEAGEAPEPDKGRDPAPEPDKGRDSAPEPDEGLEPGERPPARGIGPLATYLTDVPSLGDWPGDLVVVEVLSHLPYDLFERRDGAWSEIRVAERDGRLEEITVPAAEVLSLPDPTTATSRWRRLSGAADWMRRHLSSAESGTLAVVDLWAGSGDDEALDLDQLRQVREPVDPVPQPVPGTPLSVVTWRLG